MKLNIDEYKVHRESVATTLATRGQQEFKNVCSMYAATGACPVFVVYLFVGEIIGFDDWLMESLHRMAQFYDYNEIIGEATIDLKQFEKRKLGI